jgi:hypothetical protein
MDIVSVVDSLQLLESRPQVSQRLEGRLSPAFRTA